MAAFPRPIFPKLFLLLSAVSCLLPAQTTVTLSTSPNPSIFGAPVLMTATVTPATATGKVTFYDGVTVLGTKSLVSGVASLSTIALPAGSRKLRAYYAGSGAVASSNVVAQTVNAQPGNTFAVGPSIVSAPADSLFVLATADFNGDGKADLAISNSGTLSILLGDGNGNFQAAFNLTALNPNLGAVGDFNGDGIPDLALGTFPTNLTASLTILLGKGDGTFQPPVSYQVPNLIATLAVGDFNGDGKADIAFTDFTSGVKILLGKGDGTFQPAAAYDTNSGVQTSFVLVGDFNGDGNADIATTGYASPNVRILLGNGDGTFQLSANIATTRMINFLDGLVVGDFNGDGKADLATSNADILLGNGDGTFQPPPTYPINSTIGFSVAAGDFNGDGRPDLAIIDLSNNLSILLGNGDGTFQVRRVPYNKLSNSYLLVGEFNGDGKADLAVVSGNAATLFLGIELSITPTAGSGQSTPLTRPFPTPLQVTVKIGDSPASGVVVTFTTPPDTNHSPEPVAEPTASLSSGTATTDANGVASVTATAGRTVGSYSVTATALEVSTGFSLINLAPNVSVITASPTLPQSAVLETNFPMPLQVTLTDSSGMPAALVPVTFTTPSSGASAFVSPQFTITNSLGVASATATANRIPGSYTVTATAGALSATFSLTNVVSRTSNLAQATQSSTLPGYPTAVASSAVDGVTDGNFFDGSVTATNLDANAWWQVDLGASASITSIVIWNRTDCCGSRLNDYWVFVSDTPTTLPNRPGTFASHQIAAPNPSATIAGPAQGRYLRMQLSNANYLSLAEVQVFGTGGAAISNVAQGKAATQSSAYPGYPTDGASSAVDGNTDGNFGDGSVTATNLDANSWWQVDLGASAAINSIVIWNRTDCCGFRLTDYWVFVSDTPFLVTDTPTTLQNRANTFASHQTAAPSPSITIAGPTQGRYVRVQLSGTNYLSLAEVQVFGTGAPAISNLTQGKAATQSSTYPGYPSDGAAAAVDGNTDGNFADGSVTATNLDPNSWWQVDLGSSAAVSSIVIWNRTDCCGSRLNDYWVFVSDTPFLATDTPTTLQNRAGTVASHQTAAPNPSTTIAVGARGRYVRVQLSSANYLSLAEVQIFGQ